MQKLKPLGIALAAGLLWATTAAHAVEYTQLQPQASKITFDYQQMGVSMQGVFKRFSSQLRFDPAQVDKASAVLEVDLASVDVDSDEANDELASKTWFNTPAFPKAKFESTSIKALPTAGQYEVAGKLTIKGQVQNVVVPARFTEKAGLGVFEGQLTIQRGAFSIGEGAWKAFDIVANDVVVHFQLTAK